MCPVVFTLAKQAIGLSFEGDGLVVKVTNDGFGRRDLGHRPVIRLVPGVIVFLVTFLAGFCRDVAVGGNFRRSKRVKIGLRDAGDRR